MLAKALEFFFTSPEVAVMSSMCNTLPRYITRLVWVVFGHHLINKTVILQLRSIFLMWKLLLKYLILFLIIRHTRKVNTGYSLHTGILHTVHSIHSVETLLVCNSKHSLNLLHALLLDRLLFHHIVTAFFVCLFVFNSVHLLTLSVFILLM